MNQRAAFLLASIVTASVLAPARADSFGPDGYGNSAADNVADPQSIQPQLSLPGPLPDITFPGAVIVGSMGEGGVVEPVDDGVSGQVTLGFSFPIYGIQYEKVVASSNGFLSFNVETTADLSNDCPLPQPVAAGGERIYVLHDDLVSVVYAEEFPQGIVPHPAGTSHRAVVFQWEAEHFPVTGAFNPFTFQAILYDTGEILLLYDSHNPENGFGSTTGIQNAVGSVGLNIHCNGSNSIVDDYAVFIRPYEDCNNNFIPDVQDIASGFSEDCNDNDIPDECDVDPTDPDGNGAFSLDVDANLVPDECAPDCNGNGVPDDTDLAAGTSQDCNANTIPDECDIADGFAADCNGNGVPDHCEILAGSPAPGGPFYCTSGCDPDCNVDGIPDECEEDCNLNGIPDDCDTAPESDPAAAAEADDCEDAMLVDPAYVYFGDTFDATADGPPQCHLFFGVYDVWYRYRPAWTGTLFLHVSPTLFFGTQPTPLILSVHDGCPATAGNRLVCSDNVPFSVYLTVTKGAEYWIRVASVYYDTGAFRLQLTGPAAVLNLSDFNRNRIPDECECLADVNGDGTVDMGDFMAVMAAYGPCPGCPEDIDGSGVVNDYDLQEVLMHIGPCPF